MLVDFVRLREHAGEYASGIHEIRRRKKAGLAVAA